MMMSTVKPTGLDSFVCVIVPQRAVQSTFCYLSIDERLPGGPAVSASSHLISSSFFCSVTLSSCTLFFCAFFLSFSHCRHWSTSCHLLLVDVSCQTVVVVWLHSVNVHRSIFRVETIRAFILQRIIIPDSFILFFHTVFKFLSTKSCGFFIQNLPE